MKTCNKCSTSKPLTEYHIKRENRDNLNHTCKDCRSILNRQYRLDNAEVIKREKKRYRERYPDKIRSKKYMDNFGITLEDYDNMLTEQQHKCFICNIHQSQLKKRLAVDHCHVTNKVRGLLCSNCNRALGLFKDDIDILNKAMVYLNRQLSIVDTLNQTQ